MDLLARLLRRHEAYEEAREAGDLEKLQAALEDLDELESEIDRV